MRLIDEVNQVIDAIVAHLLLNELGSTARKSALRATANREEFFVAFFESGCAQGTCTEFFRAGLRLRVVADEEHALLAQELSAAFDEQLILFGKRARIHNTHAEKVGIVRNLLEFVTRENGHNDPILLLRYLGALLQNTEYGSRGQVVSLRSTRSETQAIDHHSEIFGDSCFFGPK